MEEPGVDAGQHPRALLFRKPERQAVVVPRAHEVEEQVGAPGATGGLAIRRESVEQNLGIVGPNHYALAHLLLPSPGTDLTGDEAAQL